MLHLSEYACQCLQSSSDLKDYLVCHRGFAAISFCEDLHLIHLVCRPAFPALSQSVLVVLYLELD